MNISLQINSDLFKISQNREMGGHMVDIKIKTSISYDDAVERFRQEVIDWAEEAMGVLPDLLPDNSHDGGTFTVGFMPVLNKRKDAVLIKGILNYRDAMEKHFRETDLWRHGYWHMNEAHHGTEHFEIFLGSLFNMMPEDETTIDQIEDAAEHIGRWSDSFDEWYDWDKHLFKSFYLGSDGIIEKQGSRINLPDHLRFANIALLAWNATHNDRYLDFSRDYAGHWADAITHSSIPFGINSDGPITDTDKFSEYFPEIGQAKTIDEIDRIENIIASGGVNLFLRMYEITGEERYINTVCLLMDKAMIHCSDPDAAVLASLALDYKKAVGDDKYIDVLKDSIGQNLSIVERVSLIPGTDSRMKPSGFGKRSDMPTWHHDGILRKFNPVSLWIAADDEVMKIHALDLSRTYIRLARRVWPPVAFHGCSAQSISAVARGHGRDNGTGVVTAILKYAIETDNESYGGRK